MLYELEVSPEAIEDYTDAYMYYESKQVGLGERFLSELIRVFSLLSTQPQYYSFISSEKDEILRDVRLAGFPFLVLFEIKDLVVIVISVHNTFKKPS